MRTPLREPEDDAEYDDPIGRLASKVAREHAAGPLARQSYVSTGAPSLPLQRHLAVCFDPFPLPPLHPPRHTHAQARTHNIVLTPPPIQRAAERLLSVLKLSPCSLSTSCTAAQRHAPMQLRRTRA
jgi:hypothetical protein